MEYDSKMIGFAFLCLMGAWAVQSQGTCDYRNDMYSMFHWKGNEQICTEDVCTKNPWLKCDVSRDFILDQARAHWPEDIELEIQYMEKYFQTLIPHPVNKLPFTCTGVCHQHSKQLQLKRIFADLTLKNHMTKHLETRRYMCFIIGPNLHYVQCGGQCKIPYGGNENYHCVPDVMVTVDVWVYCPGAEPGCHKIKFEVPLSCTCKKFTCRKALPPYMPISPSLPPIPTGWGEGIPLGSGIAG